MIPDWSDVIKQVHDQSRERAAQEHRQASLEQAEKHHAERQRWARFSVSVGALGVLLALVSFLVGRFWPTTQVAALDQRVTALERKLQSENPNPQPTTLPIRRSEQQTPVTPLKSSTPNPDARKVPEPKTLE